MLREQSSLLLLVGGFGTNPVKSRLSIFFPLNFDGFCLFVCSFVLMLNLIITGGSVEVKALKKISKEERRDLLLSYVNK